MKTIKQVDVKYINVEFIPDVKEMEEGVIYISAEYRTSSHLCLCGCKKLTICPLNKNGWTMLDLANTGKITVTPSIFNSNYECKSHYIITKGVANFV